MKNDISYSVNALTMAHDNLIQKRNSTQHDPNPNDLSTLTQPTNTHTNADINNKNLYDIIDNMQNQLKSLTRNRTSRTPNVRPQTSFRRTNASKYCWTHGACGHNSMECCNKKVGHVNHATFDNKFGGSTFFVLK